MKVQQYLLPCFIAKKTGKKMLEHWIKN